MIKYSIKSIFKESNVLFSWKEFRTWKRSKCNFSLKDQIVQSVGIEWAWLTTGMKLRRVNRTTEGAVMQHEVADKDGCPDVPVSLPHLEQFGKRVPWKRHRRMFAWNHVNAWIAVVFYDANDCCWGAADSHGKRCKVVPENLLTGLTNLLSGRLAESRRNYTVQGQTR